MNTDIATMTDEELEAFMETDDFWEEGSIGNPEDLEPEPIDAIELLTFEEASAVRLSEKNFPTGKMASLTIAAKSVWDNFANPQGMGSTDSIIYELERIFPDVEAAHRKRPLGEFKELLNLSHEEIYDELVARMQEPHEVKDGRTVSFIEVIWPYADSLYRKHLPSSEWLSQTQFFMGFSMMLFLSSIGIFLEGEVSRYLTEQIEASKLGKRFRYDEAPYTMEKEDVDGVIIDRDTEEIVCCISIKTMNALTQKTVDRYRGPKRKTRPDIYAGYRSLKDWRAEDLTWIQVPGKGNLKDILRAAIS